MYLLALVFGIIQSLLIGYILYSEIRKKSPAVFLWGTLMIMFGIPHFMTALLEDFKYSSSVINDASLFVTGFCLIYIFFRSKENVSYITLTNDKKFQIDSSSIEDSLFEKVCFGIFLFAIIGLMLSIIQSQGGILNASWSSIRSVEREYVGFSGIVGRLVFTFSGFSLFFFLTKRKTKALLVILLFIGLVLLTRNRVQLLPVFIFMASLYLLKLKTIRLSRIVVGGILICGIIYLVYAIRAFRYLGDLSHALANFSLEYINSTVMMFINNRDGELGLRQWFYFFIQMDNNFEGFNQGITYIRMLLVYLPMQWSLGLKPPSFDLYMGRAIGMAEGGSMHPTLFGDCFGNLYWFGMLLGIFWALLANLIDFQISRQKYSFFKIMLYFLASYFFVVAGRGSVYNGFQVYAWGVLILAAFKMFLLRMIRIRFSLNPFNVRKKYEHIKK